jgi:hypothetical protein
MTRNLIQAKAWKNGREKFCRVCRWFAANVLGDNRYDWDKCTNPSGKDSPEKWEGDKCKNFKEKGKND